LEKKNEKTTLSICGVTRYYSEYVGPYCRDLGPYC